MLIPCLHQTAIVNVIKLFSSGAPGALVHKVAALQLKAEKEPAATPLQNSADEFASEVIDRKFTVTIYHHVHCQR